MKTAEERKELARLACARYRAKNRDAVNCANKIRRQKKKAQYSESLKRYYQKNREIMLEKARKFRSENREKAIESKRRWYAKNGKRYYEENKDKISRASKRWKIENPKKVQSIKEAYYQSHKNEYAQRSLEYAQKNPEARREMARKRRAIKLLTSIGNSELVIKWEKLWRSKRLVKCFWCLSKFAPELCHADHIIPLSKGGKHVVDNLCISCGSCNCKKSNQLLDKWNSRITNPVLL